MQKTSIRLSLGALLVLFATLLALNNSFAGELKNESEAGIVVTGGNTQTQTISVKEQTSYALEKNLVRFNGNFLQASNTGVESAYKWGLGLRYEREISEHFSAYLGQNVESDKFQNILQRYNTDAGGKYFLSKADTLKWFAELGYRFTRSNYVGYFKNDSFLRAYTELERFFNKSVSMKFWLEYLPNLSVTSAYRINSELSLSAAISEIFSVKSAYMIRFDNGPAIGVTYKTDSIFTTALVAKF